MMFNLLLVASLLALESAAGLVRKSAFPGHGWQRRQDAPHDGRIKLHVALRHEDDGREIERQLLTISDPRSPSYRQHLGADQTAYLSTAAESSVRAVKSWLEEYGLLSNSSLFAGIFEIDTTIENAERLLETKYFVYTDGSQDVIRTEHFHLPDTVADHIDFVTPTTAFPKPGNLGRRKRSLGDLAQVQGLEERADCGADSDVTPTCVRQIYGIDYDAKPNRTTFAVYATEEASFNAADLQIYLQKYNSRAADAKPEYQVIGNGNGSSFEAQFETALDTQVFLGLAWPAKGILYNKGGVFGPNPGQIFDPFVRFLQELISNKTVPSVVSFSESMPEDMMDPAYAKRLCNMMAQVGSRGVSLLFSSGNNGPNGDQPTGSHKNIFEPEFPASCPWVTAVGGTTNLADETAATKSTISGLSKAGYTASGGGFSNLFSAPNYQSSVVSGYISKHVPKSFYSESGFNAKGRGLPDVSAFSTNFPTFVNSVPFPIGGTSAATPLWGAIVTLLNDYEASKGRPPLGFLNPFLYNLSSGLKDITTGGNNAGSCAQGCTLSKTLGYNVSGGWDPVTGLGSPIFTELRKALDVGHTAGGSTPGGGSNSGSNGGSSSGSSSGSNSGPNLRPLPLLPLVGCISVLIITIQVL